MSNIKDLEIVHELLSSISELNDIHDITVMEKGMTNKSFTFISNGKKYIIRIPGKGTDKLINRLQESTVYDAIRDKNLCDNIIYFDADTGIKITEFIPNSRVCDPRDDNDIKICFDKLKELHNMNLKVDHDFDLIKKMLFYESLMDGTPSEYDNYEDVKQRVLELHEFTEKLDKEYTLTHIDAVCDNFLITDSGVTLIDWEYAAMQDPHVDIAMFIIYAMLDEEHADNVIDIYFENKCDKTTRQKIYSYIAMCGLLWSNWCEYKKKLGVDFGDYAKAQFAYAEKYSQKEA